jgi:dolichyl-phosphate beta-glucosyltransferase
MFTDADLAYGTDVIKRVEQAFLQNPEASLVIGSRNISKDGYEGYTFIRRLASRIYIRVLCLVGGFRLSDSQCGCKAFTGSAAETIFPKCEVNRFAFDFEAILWATNHKMKIVEMPVKVINHGASKVHIFRDTFRMLKDLRRMKKRIRREVKKTK